MNECEYLHDLIETQLCDLSEEVSRINGLLTVRELKMIPANAAFGVIHGRLCDIDAELRRIWKAAAAFRTEAGEQDTLSERNDSEQNPA
jgi:hypothetical protein